MSDASRTSDNTDSSDAFQQFENRESQARYDKLVLEQATLRRQLSRQGMLLEWLKAATVPVALIGVFVTFTLGIEQLRQAEQARRAQAEQLQETRDDERFDKALSRLASQNAKERVTGISGLQLFISAASPKRHSPTLHFLLNAVADEHDPLVRKAIVDVFRDLKLETVKLEPLRAALTTAIKRNRALIRALLDVGERNYIDARNVKISRFTNISKNDLPFSFRLPANIGVKLTLEQYLQLLELDSDVLNYAPRDHVAALEDVTEVMNILADLGVYADDYSETYCVNCRFKNGKLSNAKFDNAILNDASFQSAILNGASFKNASLSDTIFYNAELKNADLTFDSWVTSDYIKFRHRRFPVLQCADLSGADLSGRPIFFFGESYSSYPTRDKTKKVSLNGPQTSNTVVTTTTKITTFGATTLTRIPDVYFTGERHNEDKEREAVNLIRNDLSKIPILLGVRQQGRFERWKSDYVASDRIDRVTSTAILHTTRYIDEAELRLQPWARKMLMQFLEDSKLRNASLLTTLRELMPSRENDDARLASLRDINQCPASKSDFFNLDVKLDDSVPD